MNTPWGDDAVDDSSYSRPDELDAAGVETCQHGVPFTENCDRCEIDDEDAAEYLDDFDDEED